MHMYLYEGPVIKFGICIVNDWKASTYAKSEAKAMSNFKYQFKKIAGLIASVKIDLPGKIFIVNEKGE